MKTPAVDLCNYLDGELAALTYDGNLFPTGEDPRDETVPHEAVFVFSIGGFALAYAGPGVSDPDGETISDLSVVIRGNPDAPADTLTLALQVRDAVRWADVPGYDDCRLRSGEPEWAGVDEQMRPKWRLRVEMIYEE